MTEGINGLVLTGGGARAAYQVGVLKALAEAVPSGAGNPFPVVSGISAGAINVASLACFGNDFHRGVDALERVWNGFRIQQVVRSDPWTMAKSSGRWFTALVSGGVIMKPPRSLLDNQPLRELLQREVPLERIPGAIERGEVQAVAVTASAYSTARSVTFFDGMPGLEEWQRMRRGGVRERLTVEHLMASVSLPFVFPATRVGHEYYGDGALRQGAPLSPALHLGADRVLVIALRHEQPNPAPSADQPAEYPSMGQIAGYMLDALFTDSLYADAERLRRINRTVDAVTSDGGTTGSVTLRNVDLMIISPSEDPRLIAARHLRALPRALRTLLWGVGALNRGGMQLISYLLFEAGFTRELLQLGYKDARSQLPELLRFLKMTP